MCIIMDSLGQQAILKESLVSNLKKDGKNLRVLRGQTHYLVFQNHSKQVLETTIDATFKVPSLDFPVLVV